MSCPNLADVKYDALYFINRLFNTAPFDELQCVINVYRVDVISTDSGADDPINCGGSGLRASTYFDASFCGGGGNRRALAVYYPTVRIVVDSLVSQWHWILVIVNSQIYGGGSGDIATTSTAPDRYGESIEWPDISIHELGHHFGLVDEYEYWHGCGIDTDRNTYPVSMYGEPASVNITADSNRNTIKWSDLILATTPTPTTTNPDCAQCDTQSSPVPLGTVGAFEGAGGFHCGLFRPEFECMMNKGLFRGYPYFCAVCKREIRRQLAPYQLSGCYAPVFKGKSFWECLFLKIIYILQIAVLSIFALFCESARCYIKKLIFRMKICRKGNTDRCIRL